MCSRTNEKLHADRGCDRLEGESARRAGGCPNKQGQRLQRKGPARKGPQWNLHCAAARGIKPAPARRRLWLNLASGVQATEKSLQPANEQPTKSSESGDGQSPTSLARRELASASMSVGSKARSASWRGIPPNPVARTPPRRKGGRRCQLLHLA